MAIDLSNIEERIVKAVGEIGLDYLAPQLEIIRTTRNLPSKIADFRLMAQKFYESYQTISGWLAPVVGPLNEELAAFEAQLEEKIIKIKFELKKEDLEFWKDIAESKNRQIRTLLQEIRQLREYILQQREIYLKAARRDILPELFGLVLWPHTEFINLSDALEEVKKAYFGTNYRYNKHDLLTDSLILTALCEDALQQQKKGRDATQQIGTLIETRLSFRKISEQFEWSKYKRDPEEGMFAENQIREIVKALIPSLSSQELIRSINTIYDEATDKYPIGKFIDWLTTAIRRRTTAGEEGGTSISDASTMRSHLIGLSFMDKHRRKETLGNISGEMEKAFERILAPFHELKQDNAFMQSAQFEIEQVMALGSQAWIYDFTGIETEILRSTLLLISDRQPKFDVLEACQRLVNNILSGRVNRNDIRQGNYIATDQLPTRVWNNIGKNLLTILEEALVKEEVQAVSLIKAVFRDEDRSRLVTSKKFIPVSLVAINYKQGVDYRDRSLRPETISIWARHDFLFQYRFAQLAGYPWYFDVNELLESLVVEALNLPTHKIAQVHGNVKLRQTVYTVDNEIYIVYYGIREGGISAMTFKETDILSEEGIDPVEVIFRPHKFLNMGPDKNNLTLVLEDARATDPKDLRTIIAGL